MMSKKTVIPTLLSQDLHLYFHSQAADLISDQEQHTDGMRQQFAADMFKALHEKKLPAYSHQDGALIQHPIPLTKILCVRPADVNDWLRKGAYKFSWNIGAQVSKTSQEVSDLDQEQLSRFDSSHTRAAKRWQICVDAKLDMPTNTFSPYPRGIGKIAKSLGIRRQSLTEDLDRHRERVM